MRASCAAARPLGLLYRQLRLRHVELIAALLGVCEILLRFRQSGARLGHLGRCRLQRQLLLRGNLRQIRLDFGELLLFRRDLFLLFEVGFVLSHQLLKIRDAALVPTCGILEIALAFRQAAVLCQGPLELRHDDIVLCGANRILEISEVLRTEVDQVLFGLCQALLGHGDRQIGLRDSEIGDRLLEVSQLLLGRQRVALGLVQRLLIGRGVDGRQRLAGLDGVACSHIQGHQRGCAAHLFEGKIRALHRGQLADHGDGGVQVPALRRDRLRERPARRGISGRALACWRRNASEAIEPEAACLPEPETIAAIPEYREELSS